jgi:hypothetical protein
MGPVISRLGLHTLELDAVIELHDVDAVEHPEEVEVPPGATELTVARDLETRGALAGDEVDDLRVLDRSQLRIRQLSRCAAAAGGGQARRAEEASDDVGTERR